jgi:hypothetical protein|uniref:Uncharacterized protein n=1 Tax=viral metagenome TaxID=1070528 RepID=A0A6C0CCS2_9ZZZZ
MEHTYYFSQGRMTYNKFKEPVRDIETGLMNATKDANATNSSKTASNGSGGGFLSNLWNFQLYNKSILRYK